MLYFCVKNVYTKKSFWRFQPTFKYNIVDSEAIYLFIDVVSTRVYVRSGINKYYLAQS